MTELLLLLEEHANTSVVVMQCITRNNNLYGVILSHHHNLKFTFSKIQGKKSHSMSGRLPIQMPAETQALASKDKT